MAFSVAADSAISFYCRTVRIATSIAGALSHPIPRSVSLLAALGHRRAVSLPSSSSRLVVKASSSPSSSLSSPSTVAESPVFTSVPTKPIEGQKTGTSGLRKKVKVLMQGNYLANWIQVSAEDYEGGLLVLGGDDRYFNREAAQIIIKTAAGNGVGKILVGNMNLIELLSVAPTSRNLTKTT